MHNKAYKIYNKSTRNIEESIHVIFENDGKLNDSVVQGLNLNKHSGDEEETSRDKCYRGTFTRTISQPKP